MRILSRFWRLPGERRRLLVQAAVLLGLVRLALLVLPFKTVNRLVRRLHDDTRVAGSNAPAITEIVWAVQAASRGLPGATCLTQALAGRVLLARAGHPSELRIGVRREPARGFEAHAWLEHDGEIVLGQTTDQTPFVPLSAPSERAG